MDSRSRQAERQPQTFGGSTVADAISCQIRSNGDQGRAPPYQAELVRPEAIALRPLGWELNGEGDCMQIR